jgi:ABC-type sugar transport system substrate-binding protein
MKKRILAMLLTTVLAFSMFATAAMAESTGDTEGVEANEEFYAKADFSILEGKKLGITIQSLQNAYWAGVMTALGEFLDEQGAEYTIVACDDSSATQIGQIENFISAGCDLIMCHPSDAAAVEDVCAQAREAGIKVMCWDDPMENTDANWILNNHNLGNAIGQMAGEFINEKYSEDNKAEVIVIGYPQTKILLEREEGIMEGLEQVADGKYEIVANQAGIIASDAQTAVETTLQAHPDAKIVAGIGAGAMIGADEALNIYTNGEIPDDMGVFTTDVTKQQLEQLADETYPAKGIIGFEGSDEDTARSCAAMYALILADNVGAQNVFRGFTKITPETVEEIQAGMK